MIFINSLSTDDHQVWITWWLCDDRDQIKPTWWSTLIKNDDDCKIWSTWSGLLMIMINWNQHNQSWPSSFPLKGEFQSDALSKSNRTNRTSKFLQGRMKTKKIDTQPCALTARSQPIVLINCSVLLTVILTLLGSSRTMPTIAIKLGCWSWLLRSPTEGEPRPIHAHRPAPTAILFHFQRQRRK